MDQNERESSFCSFSTDIMSVSEVFCQKYILYFFGKIIPQKDNSLSFYGSF